MKKTKKINTRITPVVEAKLREIVKASGSNMSEIIMRAIEQYYNQGLVAGSRRPYEIAKRNRIIGCGKGSGKLSQRYKDEVFSIIRSKL